jgi:preprotein translocase subunit SecE
VARDRKRAKQRRARRGASQQASTDQRSAGAPADERPQSATERPEPVPASGSAGPFPSLSPSSGRIERADLPGALEHAGDVDEFDAAIVAGAHGVAATPETLSEAEIEAEAEAEGDLSEDELQELALAPGAEAGNGAEGVGPERASGAPIRSGNRAIGFLRASWAELQRVQWPDRRHVFQATAVVLGFVAVAGVYLGVADTVAKEIVEFIL